jgi:hypothetical protein
MSLLKITQITGLLPWVLFDTGIIIYHLITEEMLVNYMRITYYELYDK